MKIDTKEIRFWIRSLGMPEHHNTSIDMDLVDEIPAFLHHLESVEDLDFTKSRMVFTPDEINNSMLEEAKEESKSWLYKELFEVVSEYMEANSLDSFFATVGDIKEKFFSHNNKVEASYLRRVLKDDFNMSAADSIERYYKFGITTVDSNVGRPFEFKAADFGCDINPSPQTDIIQEYEDAPF